MVMTLHTLQFNPIINILTQRKVTTKIFFFFGRELLVLLCLALVGPHGRSECSEKKIKLESVDLDVKLNLNMKLQGTQHRKEVADVLQIRKMAGLL